MTTVAMATEQEQGPSTPLPAAKPRVDVSGGGADDTVFSPGIVTPNHTISSLFRNISNTTGVQQGGKGDSKLGRVAATDQERTHETPAKQKGCWGKLRKVTMGK